MDQLKRILQTNQLKNASKRLQHRIDRTVKYINHVMDCSKSVRDFLKQIK